MPGPSVGARIGDALLIFSAFHANWQAQWIKRRLGRAHELSCRYPVAAVEDTDPARPHPVTLLGVPQIIKQARYAGSWRLHVRLRFS